MILALRCYYVTMSDGAMKMMFGHEMRDANYMPYFMLRAHDVCRSHCCYLRRVITRVDDAMRAGARRFMMRWR